MSPKLKKGTTLKPKQAVQVPQVPSGGGRYKISVGPIHPALKEPIYFNFVIEGEKIMEVDVKPGMAHRGIEWMGLRRNPIQTVYLAERICGICSASHPFAFTRAVEMAADIEVPERAQYIRTIIGELERVHSHILWAGVAAHEIGFDTLFYKTWDVREKAMDLLEYLTGNRVNYGIWMVGGVRRDLKPEQFPKIMETIEFYEELLEPIQAMFLEDKTITMRTRGTGILEKKEAIRLNALGPTARASGVGKDVRVDDPYHAYADMNLKPQTPEVAGLPAEGDVYDRIICRLLELGQTLEILRHCVENLPDGPITSQPKPVKLLNTLKKAEGQGFGRHEAPRGESFHRVDLKAGEENASVWKVRAPTYSNLQTWIPMMLGEQIADIPIVAASIDPCMSCMDRVTLTDANSGKQHLMTGKELRRLSLKKTRDLQRRHL